MTCITESVQCTLTVQHTDGTHHRVSATNTAQHLTNYTTTANVSVTRRIYIPQFSLPATLHCQNFGKHYWTADMKDGDLPREFIGESRKDEVSGWLCRVASSTLSSIHCVDTAGRLTGSACNKTCFSYHKFCFCETQLKLDWLIKERWLNKKWLHACVHVCVYVHVCALQKLFNETQVRTTMYRKTAGPCCTTANVSDFIAVTQRFRLQIISEHETVLVLRNHLVHLWSLSTKLHELSSFTADCTTTTYQRIIS